MLHVRHWIVASKKIVHTSASELMPLRHPLPKCPTNHSAKVFLWSKTCGTIPICPSYIRILCPLNVLGCTPIPLAALVVLKRIGRMIGAVEDAKFVVGTR